MLVLGIDLETTGLDVGHDEIIEIGAVLWDWKKAKPIKMQSELIQIHAPLNPEITQITGITDADLSDFGVDLNLALADLHDLARSAQYIVAHNGLAFDRLFLEKAWLKAPQTKLTQGWIDTLIDVPYPPSVSTRKLNYLATEHGFLNPFAHRALFDVLTMLKVLSHYSPEAVLELQASPLCKVVAQVQFEQKDLAKNEGFRWDPKQRHWYLEGKECQLKGKNFPFPVVWL